VKEFADFYFEFVLFGKEKLFNPDLPDFCISSKLILEIKRIMIIPLKFNQHKSYKIVLFYVCFVLQTRRYFNE